MNRLCLMVLALMEQRRQTQRTRISMVRGHCGYAMLDNTTTKEQEMPCSDNPSLSGMALAINRPFSKIHAPKNQRHDVREPSLPALQRFLTSSLLRLIFLCSSH